MDKYYIGTIFERNGEYEYWHTIRLKLTNRQKPEAALKRITADWYGGNKYQDSNVGWYYNCGEVYVEAGNWKEISKETFDELEGIVNGY